MKIECLNCLAKLDELMKIFSMQAAKGTLDGLLDTIPVVHPIMPLLDLLKPHKQLVLLTVQEYKPLEFTAFPLMLGKYKNIIFHYYIF